MAKHVGFAWKFPFNRGVTQRKKDVELHGRVSLVNKMINVGILHRRQGLFAQKHRSNRPQIFKDSALASFVQVVDSGRASSTNPTSNDSLRHPSVPLAKEQQA
jgi:hypothetical protein